MAEALNTIGRSETTSTLCESSLRSGSRIWRGRYCSRKAIVTYPKTAAYNLKATISVDDETSRTQRSAIRVKVKSPLASRTRLRKHMNINARLRNVPLLRGKIHLLLLLTSPLWIYGLLRRCQSWKATASVIIAVTTAVLNFGCSTLLHNVHWDSYSKRTFWRRLDHAGIFLMISGSCAPIPILRFSGTATLLWVLFQWGSTLVGIITCMCSDAFSISDHYGMRAAVYAIVGLSNVAFTREFWRVLGDLETWLLFGLAITYVTGACFYGCKWPNIWPKVFGYHEVFHLMCLVAACFTFMLNYRILERDRPQDHGGTFWMSGGQMSL